MQDCMIRRDREVQKSKEIPDDDEVASLLEGGSHEQSWPSSPTEIAALALTFSWVGRLRAFCARALLPHAT